MRRLPPFAVPVVLALPLVAVAACAGGATPGPVDTPTALPSDPQPTQAPSPTPVATIDDGSIDPGDFVATEWTAGSVDVRIRDGYDADFTVMLSAGSFLAGNTAYLAYGEGDPWVVQVVLEGETGDGFVLTGPIVSGGGTDDGNCTFDVARKDASAVEARIECPNTGGFEGATVHESLDVFLTVRASR